ncbi:MAG: NADH-quinone oxidoreductase subunit J [Chitinophagales bacterium]|nr:NADH-quinone oxidoreductase subunit J [Chitinophagales bacterium]
MTASQIIFYLIAAFILGCGILSMTTRKIFRSAIWLLFSLIGVSALYFWLQVEFIAAVQIVVYVGGIVVLIIFSVFLTQQSGTEMPKAPRKRMIASILAVLFGFAFTFSLIYKNNFKAGDGKFDSDISRIGDQMLSTGEQGFALPFEAVSILLLAAMIGCIVIAMKAPTHQQAASQAEPKENEGNISAKPNAQ